MGFKHITRHLYRFLLCGILIAMTTISYAQSKSPLLADEAFQFSVSAVAADKMVINWRIAPGYYLYAERMNITTSPKQHLVIQYPKGKLKQDTDGQAHAVFSGKMSIPVTLQTSNQQTIQLNIAYQGCSAEGFCYPPMEKQVSVPLVKQASPATNVSESKPSFSLVTLLTDQNGVQTLLQGQHSFMLLLLFLSLGLLLAFTPCVLPMIPILTSIILGQKQPTTTKKAFSLSLTYVIGMAITYACAGVLAAIMGSSLQVWMQQPWVVGIMSSLFVLLSFSLFGLYELRLPNRFHNQVNQLSNRMRGGTFTGVFCMGVLSTLIVSPCVTAPLVGVLMYIAQAGNIIFGASALFAIGIGMGIPLLLIGVSAGKWLPKTGPWMELIKKLFGIFMLAMAIWLLSRVVSGTMVILLWDGLFIISAMLLGGHLPYLIGRRKYNRLLGMLAGVSGMVLVFGGGMPDSTMKWMKASQHSAAFTVVHNVDDFKQKLADARAHKKQVILDFYADWCDSCVSMEKKIFNSEHVQKAMSNYVLLRADLSSNTMSDQAMLKYFNVIAPPTVIFFNAQGKEIDSLRIVGEVNKKEFLSHLGSRL